MAIAITSLSFSAWSSRAPRPRTRKDRAVLIDLAARFGCIHLGRLEASTEAYLRACQSGADWPQDPTLVTLQSRLGRYLLKAGPPPDPEPDPDNSFDYHEVVWSPGTGEETPAADSFAPPPEVLAAATKLFHPDPAQRETPPTAALLWWQKHTPEVYEAASRMIHAIQNADDAQKAGDAKGVLYG